MEEVCIIFQKGCFREEQRKHQNFFIVRSCQINFWGFFYESECCVAVAACGVLLCCKKGLLSLCGVGSGPDEASQTLFNET